MSRDEALFAGNDGLDAYRELAPQLPRLLDAGGLAAIEIGYDQAEAVTGLAGPRRACRLRLRHDLGGRPRAVLLTWVLVRKSLGIRRVTTLHLSSRTGLAPSRAS